MTGCGIVLKGDGHVVYSNTFFSNNYTEMCMPSCVEPLKKWRTQYPLKPQNTNRTLVLNVAARRDYGFPCSCHNSSFLNRPGGQRLGMFNGSDLGLSDPGNFDFRPTASSKLVDAGEILPPYTDGYIGSAPDIGAYEYGGEWWKAGYIHAQ